MNPTTLITGAPGWLGTRLVQLLVEGMPDLARFSTPNGSRRIRCLVKPGENDSALRRLSDRVEIVWGDLRDQAALGALFRDAEGATLFHCAGIVHPVRRVRELYDVNVTGTQSLMSAAEKAHVRQAVSISSISPIGFSYRADELFDESAPFHPYMNYGRSKMLMEQLLQEFQARGKLQNTILRATWFYGLGQPPRQDTFFQMIRRGYAPILGSGENRRSMTYIDNLCQAMFLCEGNPTANGQTYWVADRRAYTVNEIVDTIESLMEKEFGLTVAHRRMRLPFFVGEAAMWADRVFQGLGLQQQKIHVLGEMNKTIACSVAKAEQELGYKPAIELEEGMRRSIAWCLANNHPL